MQLTEYSRRIAVPAVTRKFGRPLDVEQIDIDRIEAIYELNEAIFQEQRVINTFERADLIMLLASVGDRPVGFKVGYRENRFAFYSAKGGVLEAYRRCGIARALLHEMMSVAQARGYRRFSYDTFPNRHPGMVVMGLMEGFRVVKADYNPTYKDYRIRLETKL